jgi:hypothetical protein
MAVIEKFWVVTMPAERSTLDDICFEIDWLGLENQFRGGVKSEEIRAVYDIEEEAKENAERLIRWRKDEPTQKS